jgi:hypothetical protein
VTERPLAMAAVRGAVGHGDGLQDVAVVATGGPAGSSGKRLSPGRSVAGL